MPTASDFLERWHGIIASKDLAGLDAVLHDDIQFRSPFFFKPKEGKGQAMEILQAVATVLEDFTYHREVIDELTLALEFSANVGDLSLKGIDLIQLDQDGKMIDLEVFIRPANALQAVGMAMMKRLGGAAAQGT